MGMIYILIPLSLVLVGVAVWGFLWAVEAGQFDDLDTPAWDVLGEDQHEPTQAEREPSANSSPHS